MPPLYPADKDVEPAQVAGVSASSPTIQNILIKLGMASRYNHWLKLEKKRAGDPIELTGEQVAFIGEQNPAFWERHVESFLPWELLRQDTSYVAA